MCGGCSTRRVRRECWKNYDSLMGALDHREDIDQSFSYYTKQEVSFRDRKLGITYYVLCALVAGYIIGYMFIYSKGYLQYEQAKGATVTHVFGDAVAMSSGKPASRYFSAEEVSYPGLENGAIFIATRQRVHRQKRGFCEDFQRPCTTKSDCTHNGNGTCSPNGYCKEHSWCDQDEKPEMYELDTHSMQIWLRSTIQYVKLAPSLVFSTDANNPKPMNGENVFTIRELLMKCEPLPVRFEEVSELGAVVEVQLLWECGIKSNNIFTWLDGLFSSQKDEKESNKCKPTIKARRLDTIFDPDNIGFGFSYPEYLDDNERDRNEVRGIRVVFITAGIGRKISVQESVTKASLGASLFGIAKIIADLFMIKLFYLRKKYKARKFETSPDFSEHLAYLEEKRKSALPPEAIDKKEQAQREAEEKWMMKLDEEDD